MHVYTAACPGCQTPVEWANNEQLEDCCPDAVLRRVTRIVASDQRPIKRETWRQLQRALR